MVDLRETWLLWNHVVAKSHERGFDPKASLVAMKTRLPNRYDPLSHWEDILLWRSHVFEEIVKALSGSVDPTAVWVDTDGGYEDEICVYCM